MIGYTISLQNLAPTLGTRHHFGLDVLEHRSEVANVFRRDLIQPLDLVWRSVLQRIAVCCRVRERPDLECMCFRA